MGFLDKIKDKQEQERDKHLSKADAKYRPEFEKELSAGESIVALVHGVSTKRDDRLYNGALAVTNQRLIFRGSYATKVLVETHPLGSTTGVSYARGKIAGTLGVKNGSETIEYAASSSLMDDFMESVRSASSVESSVPEASASSATDELAKLADLHAQGILSDEEFSAAKQRIIGGM